MSSVFSSISQYWRRSLPDTSALLPTLTNVEMPRLRSPARARMASPSAPLCDDIAMRPGGGNTGEKDAFIRIAGSVFSSPMQFGPIILIPWPRTRSRSCLCSTRPVSSASANPAVITMSALTPRLAHSSTTPSTASRGTEMIARSTGSGSWLTEGKTRSDPISEAFGFTG